MDNYKCIVGVDIRDTHTQISYWKKGMLEPLSISPIAGSESYLIPTGLKKKKGLGQWYFVDEEKQDVETYTHLLEHSLSGDMIEVDHQMKDSKQLFAIFLRKVLALGTITGCQSNEIFYIFTLEQCSTKVVHLLMNTVKQLSLMEKQVRICSYEESFAHFVMNQEESIRTHHVLLFDYTNDEFRQYDLTQNFHMNPVVISINAEENYDFDREKEASIHRSKDQIFYDIIVKATAGKIVSCAYLVGDGYDGEWMDQSTAKLCQNRRVFIGKNLFTKGACYFGGWHLERQNENKTPKYIFLGDGQVKENVLIKVKEEESIKLVNLLNAGESWQDCSNDKILLLEDSDTEEVSLEVVLKALDGHMERTYVLKLADLPMRPPKATKVLVEASRNEAHDVLIRVTDLGFGELFKSSNKVWEATYEQLDDYK